MKTPHIPHLALLLSAFVIQHSSFVIAQGPLTPPGAPAPTMKTLDQLEARTPISSAPITISTAGSYYLVGNLTVADGNGILINASEVTIDLNGFTISSTANPASGAAITVGGGRRNLTIRNGHIRGATTFAAGTFATGGFLDGITNFSVNSRNLRVSEVSIAGVADDAIDLGGSAVSSWVVERCNVAVCGGNGILAGVVRECIVTVAGDSAITADVVSDSCGECVGSGVFGRGILGTALVDNCRGVSVDDAGVQGGQVRNSSGTTVSGTGVAAQFSAQNCQGISNTGSGLSAHVAINCQGLSSTGTFGVNSSAGTASFCRGGLNGGTAIIAGRAIGCTVTGTGTVSSTKKFLGTP